MRNEKNKKSISEIERDRDSERNIEKFRELNLSYIDFIKYIIDSKIEDKENIKREYENRVSLVFENIKRVDNRVKREVLRESLKNELVKREIEIEKFMEISNKIVRMSNKSKENSNYLVVNI
jgi:hypothetical protein